MSDSKLTFEELETGREFPGSVFSLDKNRVEAYLAATGSSPDLFLVNNLVPPMAVAALSMGAMMDCLILPPGAIHVSQDVSFLHAVSIGEKLSGRSFVKRKIDRSRMRMLTIGITVSNEHGENVMSGETGFIVPQPAEGATP